MQKVVRELLDFIDASPVCYYAIKSISETLDAEGYQRLREYQPWKVVPGGKYYTTRGESAIIAFRVPKASIVGFMMASAHSDSPTFKVRQQAEVPSSGNTVRLSVEGYGGAIMRSWTDKPLSVAGRVFVRKGDGLESRLVNVDRDLLVIPSLAIHMNREVNKGVELKTNVDMLPLFAVKERGVTLNDVVAAACGVGKDDLVSTELFLYPRTPGTCLGAGEEFVAAPRLDDLEAAFCCMKGFLAAKESASVPVLCVFNNEEVGSGTRQGADSTFLSDVLNRLAGALGMDAEALQIALANSFMVSADNGHAVHPAHPEYADANEFPVLNGGVVLKYNAAQKYTTDGLSGGVFCEVCRRAGAPFQRYSNRADLPGGSTLGRISVSHVSVATVDIGLPQLAMHSCYEVGGVKDVSSMISAMTTYYGCSFRRYDDSSISL